MVIKYANIVTSKALKINHLATLGEGPFISGLAFPPGRQSIKKKKIAALTKVARKIPIWVEF
jgi:hypothetical protein